MVMLQNAQRPGSSPFPELGEPPLFPEMLSQVVLYKSNQVNVAWEVVPVFRRTHHP